MIYTMAMIYTNKIKDAVFFASKAHIDQKRKILEYPYISHPLSILFVVSQYTKDEDVLVSAILHDTVEDTDTSLDEIETNFGKRVRDMVDILSEDNTILDPQVKKQKQLERFKNASHDVLLIKLADIIVNFCDITLVLNNHTKEEYFEIFGSNLKDKISGYDERILVIEKAWPENPLIEEVKIRFDDYKNALAKLDL